MNGIVYVYVFLRPVSSEGLVRMRIFITHADLGF